MSSVRDWLDDNGGERHPPFKFTQVGDVCRGVVAENAAVRSTPNMNTGKPEDKVVIAVELEDGSVENGRPCTPGEVRSVWIKGGFPAGALKTALLAANANNVLAGGRFAIKLVEHRDTGKPQPAKVFAAQYEPPANLGAVLLTEDHRDELLTPAPAPAASTTVADLL